MYEGYRYGHIMHHGWVGTSKDPRSDSEKYDICDITNPKLYLLFLKDLLGISRKHAIPLLEFTDRQGVTVRSGDVRKKGSQL